MSDSKKKKLGPVGTLVVALVAVLGILVLGKLCLNIIKYGKVEYIMDMGRNSGSKKDASLAGDNGFENTKGRLQSGEEGTSLLDIKEAGWRYEGSGNGGNHRDDAIVQSAVSADDNYEDGNVASNMASDVEGGSEQYCGGELTEEEIQRITIFAKYLSSTFAPAAETVSGMTVQLADETVIKTMGIMANDYMNSVDSGSLEAYVVPGIYDDGVLYLSTEDVNRYIANIFDYTDIQYYEFDNVMSGAYSYEIWAHQGICDTTITVLETYAEGENYVMKGIASLNYMDIFDPRFVDAEFTFTVRRNSDSPFGFTFVDFKFGEVTYQ